MSRQPITIELHPDGVVRIGEDFGVTDGKLYAIQPNGEMQELNIGVILLFLPIILQFLKPLGIDIGPGWMDLITNLITLLSGGLDATEGDE